jgi:hypothetical protein
LSRPVPVGQTRLDRTPPNRRMLLGSLSGRNVSGSLHPPAIPRMGWCLSHFRDAVKGGRAKAY